MKRLQFLAIDDLEMATVVGDQAGLLERARHHRDGRPARTEHHRHESLRQREHILTHAVMRQQQPAGEPLLEGVHDVAGG